MKIIAPLIISLVCASSLWGQDSGDPFGKPDKNKSHNAYKPKQKEEVFLVSEVGSKKNELHEVFKLIQKEEKRKKYGEPISLEILQKLNDKGFLAYKTVTRYRTIASRSASIGGGGGAYTTSSEVTDRSKLYYLVTLKANDIADGERLKSICVIETSKMKSYTDTRGAKRTVRILEEITPVDLSQQDFVKRLKGGESWVLKRFREKRCKNCFGDGKLNAMKNYAKCPDCKGKGATVVDCIVKW